MRTQEAIDHFKTSKALADALGVKPSAISQWGEVPPLPRQYQIQVLTKNKLRVTKAEAACAERPAVSRTEVA